MKKQITMSMIAEKAQLSQPTVSRVLNGEPIVSEKTAQRVRKLAGEMGYKVQPFRKSKTDTQDKGKVLIISSTKPEDVMLSMSNTIQAELSNRDFEGILVESKQADIKIKGVRGIIWLQKPSSPDLLKRFEHLPSVQVLGEPGLPEKNLNIVTYDYRMVGALAAKWLVQKGHTNLVAIMPDNYIAKIRTESFKHFAEQSNCNVNVIKIKKNFIGSEDAEDAVRQITRLQPAVTGFFAFNDFAMLSLYPSIMQSALSRNENLDFIGCDARPFLFALSPKLATIDVKLNKIAKRASEVLISRIYEPYKDPESVMLFPSLLEPGTEKVNSIINNLAIAYG